MSFIGKNIKKIRGVKRLSQSAFAEIFGLTRASVGAYEELRAEPKVETILQIAKHFSISVENLLTKELTVNQLYQFDIFKEEIVKAGGATQPVGSPAQIAAPSRAGIPIVLRDLVAQYTEHLGQAQFLDQLPQLEQSQSLLKADRIFQVGDETIPELGILRDDMLLCKSASIKDVGLYQAGSVFLVVARGRLFLRMMHTDRADKIILKAGDPAFKTIELNPEEVDELWKVTGVINQRIEQKTLLEERVNQMEKQLDEITEKFNQLNKSKQ